MSLATRELAIKLMELEDERDIVRFLMAEGYWSDDSAWSPVGGTSNNYSTIGNQQSDAFAALTEKIINSVDAYLVEACELLGIDPSSAEAPSSMADAIKLFGLKLDGNPNGLTVREAFERGVNSSELTNWARMICIVVTGPRGGDPGISVIDHACGQTPDAFPDTFLSLNRGNKINIPFVQGKFNMGGSGALRFCSENHHLQLIVSRRNQTLLSSAATARDRDWGVTLIRQRPPKLNERMSVYEYLAPRNSTGNPEILSFDSPTFPLLPDESKRKAFCVEATHGSLMKMYGYRWPDSLASHSTQIQGKSTVMHLNCNLPDALVPVRVYELRGYAAHAPTMNVYGLRARFEHGEIKERLEPEAPITGSIMVGDVQLPIRTYVFKYGEERMSTYRASYGVIFSLNGQRHGSLPETFFARRNVDLGPLRKVAVVVVECDELDTRAREQLLMNSRDRLADTQLAGDVERELSNWLKKNEVLRELKRRHIEAELNRALGTDISLVDLFRRLVRENPTLAEIFKMGNKVPTGRPEGEGGGETGASKFAGREFPTYFRFFKRGDALSREISLGQRANISFETDARNDYLSRNHEPGSLTWETSEIRGETVRGNIGSLHQGSLQVQLNLPVGAIVGDVHEIVFQVADVQKVDPIICKLSLLVCEPIKSGKSGGEGGNEGRVNPNSDNGGKGGNRGIDLPRIIPVHRNEWPEGWSDVTALDVVLSVDNKPEAFRVNMDNKFLLHAQHRDPKNAELLSRKFQFGLAFLAVSVIVNEDSFRSQIEAGLADDLPLEEIVRSSMTGVAQSILSVIDVLGKLTVADFDSSIDE
jgi:hypothetical protein